MKIGKALSPQDAFYKTVFILPNAYIIVKFKEKISETA